MKCFVCEKAISFLEDSCLNHAGHIEIEFGYGSDYDLCNIDEQNAKTFSGFICDDCFSTREQLVEIKNVYYKRIVGK